MKHIMTIALIFFAFQIANASVPRAHKAKAVKYALTIQTTKDTLDLPFAERIETLREQGAQGYRNLTKVMFDTKESMEYRWRAVTAAGRLGGKEALPEIKRALVSSDWYMRNAALVALQQIDRNLALTWAKKFLDDKALVVRVAAVDVIAQLHDSSSNAILWTKLYAKDNFRSNQSLFIRRRIVETLAEMETPGHEGSFIRVLEDRDDTLHGPAVSALERLTKRQLGDVKTPVKFKKAAWEQWWKESRLQ